jgi:hypothetical protein
LPQWGSAKLNVDGAFNANAVGVGMVLRDHAGTVIFTACRSLDRCRDAIEAELVPGSNQREPEAKLALDKYAVLEHLQPLAPPTAKSGDKSRWIGRKLGVGSAELPAGTPARRPEIGIFGLFLEIDVSVWRISYSLPTFGSNKRYSSANFI